MKIIINSIKHLTKILIHKYWVCYYCFQCGLYWRGIIHDLSKFSPVEFFESAKYYQGDSSPINIVKKEKGYSKAWQHHKGRNKHHYEYWTDNYDNGTTCIEMPFISAVEMLCDYLGAARAYWGKNFTYKAEYDWWCKKSKTAKMHVNTKRFITRALEYLKSKEEFGCVMDKALDKRTLLHFYL